MKVGAIIAARMTSRRLPGKPLMKLGGRTMLEWVVRGVQAAGLVERIVVVTPADVSEIPIHEECARLGVSCDTGSVDRDVLGDFYNVAHAGQFDAVVRVTADCPLVNPVLIDAVVALYATGCDYATNALDMTQRTFPRGLDVEVVSFATLRWMHHNLTPERTPFGRWSQDYRKHVTLYIKENPWAFRIKTLEANLDNMHLTVDTQEQYECMRQLFDLMGDAPSWWRAGELIETRRELSPLSHKQFDTVANGRVW